MERSLDYKGRWRNHTVAFRVSDEEAKLLNDLVALSGLTKQEYIIRRLTCRDVVVQGNPRVYKALKNQMAAIHEELKRLETVSPDNDELLYTLQVITITLEGLKGEDFQRRNPTLRVFSACLHMDEATPHLHIDFVPYMTGSKRGLDTRVSLKQALSVLGFKGGTRRETELNQWVLYEKKQLAAVMLEHGIEWEQKGIHEKHLSVLDFEKQERAKEVAELEAKKESLEEHNVAILEVSEKWLDELENLEHEIHSAQENREEADKQAEKAKEEAERYDKKLTEIAPMVKDMERFAVKYSYDPEEVLPEAGTLESGKTYREKKAKPLIGKIVTVLRSVYREYLNISNRYTKLQVAYSRGRSGNERLTNRLEEVLEENRELRTIATDFGRVKSVVGVEQVNAVIDRAKQQEQIEAEQKRAARRKYSREAR